MKQVQNAVKTSKKVATKKVTERVTPKKKAVKSEATLLKQSANNSWKNNTRSMSALVRYCKGDGKDEIVNLINATNKLKGTKVQFGQVANIKTIVDNASERELFKNANPDKSKGAKFIKGEKKSLFSFWLIVLTVGRLAKK